MSDASDLKSEILSRVPADGGTIGNTKLQGLLREAGVEVSEAEYFAARDELVEDDELFEKKMARLTKALGEQFSESAKLETAIKRNLEGLGFEV